MVHPHVRGEQPRIVWCSSPLSGSSPRTWGTELLEPVDIVPIRFIPTYVGNRPAARRSIPIPPVHPHVRGEQRIQGKGIYTEIGSSPRTWGTGTFGMISTVCGRFIPTYVGNSFRARRLNRLGTVHPHVRGEQWRASMLDRPMGGSSPRTWGTGQEGPNFLPRPWFIPTYVGNSVPGRSRRQ